MSSSQETSDCFSSFRSSDVFKGKRKLVFDTETQITNIDLPMRNSCKRFSKHSSKKFKRISFGNELLNTKYPFNATINKNEIKYSSSYLDFSQRIESSKDKFIELAKRKCNVDEDNFIISDDPSPQKNCSTFINKSIVSNSTEIDFRSVKKSFITDVKNKCKELFEVTRDEKCFNAELSSPVREEFDKISNTSSPDNERICYDDVISEDPSPIKCFRENLSSRVTKKDHDIEFDFKAIKNTFKLSRIETNYNIDNKTKLYFPNLTPLQNFDELYPSPCKDKVVYSPVINKLKTDSITSEEKKPLKNTFSIEKIVPEDCMLNFTQVRNEKGKPLRNVNHDYNEIPKSFNIASPIKLNYVRMKYTQSGKENSSHLKAITYCEEDMKSKMVEKEEGRISKLCYVENFDKREASCGPTEGEIEEQLLFNDDKTASLVRNKLTVNILSSEKSYQPVLQRTTRAKRKVPLDEKKNNNKQLVYKYKRKNYVEPSNSNTQANSTIKEEVKYVKSCQISENKELTGNTQTFYKKCVGEETPQLASSIEIQDDSSSELKEKMDIVVDNDEDFIIDSSPVKSLDCKNQFDIKRTSHNTEKSFLNYQNKSLLLPDKFINCKHFAGVKYSTDNTPKYISKNMELLTNEGDCTLCIEKQSSSDQEKISSSNDSTPNCKQIIIEDYTPPEMRTSQNFEGDCTLVSEEQSPLGDIVTFNHGSPKCKSIIIEDVTPPKMRTCLNFEGDYTLVHDKQSPLHQDETMITSNHSTPECKQLIDDTSQEKSISDFHLTILDCSSQNALLDYSTYKVESSSSPEILHQMEDGSHLNVNHLENEDFPEDVKKPNEEYEEFNKKRIKKGSLLERAHKIILKLRNESILFPHELNFGLRSPYEGHLVSDRLQVYHLSKEDETYYLKCSPLIMDNAENLTQPSITLVVTELPDDICLNSALVVHFPVTVIFKTRQLETLVFVRNRIKSCKKDLISANYQDYLRKLEKKQIEKKIIRNVTSRLSKNILDSMAGLFLVHDSSIELTVINKQFGNDSEECLQLHTVDSEREVCIIRINHSSQKQTDFVEGYTYEFVGFKLFDVALIDKKTLSFIEYKTVCPVKSNTMYIFQPVLKDWKVKLIKEKEPVCNNVSSLLTVKHIQSDYRRFRVMVESWNACEGAVRLWDSSLLPHEFVPLETQVNLDTIKMSNFMLDCVYYLNGHLIFDTFSKISPC